MSTVGLSYPKTSEVEYEEFVNIVLKNFKELDWIFSGKLDFKNIQAEGITTKNLHAEAVTAAKILANTITALQIAANAIETDKLKAGAVTADKITVTELSAIAADLGHITAGLIEAVTIYGALIATANGTYPRIELSNTANLLTAFKSLTNFLKIDADITDPSIIFDNGVVRASLFNFTSFGSTFAITSDAALHLFASSGNVSATSLAGTITDIVAEINGKAPAFTGYTGTMIPGQTAVISNGIITNVI